MDGRCLEDPQGLNRLRRLLLLGCAALPMLGCAVVMGERTVRLPRERLEAEVARRLPGPRDLGGIDLVWREPKLRMLTPTQRMALDLAFDWKLPLLGHSVQGALAIETGLRFDAEQLAIVLDDPRLTRVTWGEGELGLRGADRIGAAVTALLGQRSLHRFRPEDLRYAGSDWRPAEIRVRDDALEIMLRRQ
jgi:hypothetical protein